MTPGPFHEYEPEKVEITISLGADTVQTLDAGSQQRNITRDALIETALHRLLDPRKRANKPKRKPEPKPLDPHEELRLARERIISERRADTLRPLANRKGYDIDENGRLVPMPTTDLDLDLDLTPDRDMRTTTYEVDPESGVPPRHIAVHNHIRPQPNPGAQGFRAWLAAPADTDTAPRTGPLADAPTYRVERCDCNWAPHLNAHYRVRGPDA